MTTEEEFINGRTCGNPGCGAFVKLKKQRHELGFEFKIWQCGDCGWICEYSGPIMCQTHSEPLSYVADGNDGPIFDCIKCMVKG